MGQNHYLVKRTDRRFFTFQSVFYIPKDLQNYFGRKSFKVSLKSCNYKDCKKISRTLHVIADEIYKDLRMGKLKNLNLDEVKSLLKREVELSLRHIQYVETGTGTTETQVLHSLQHITQEEISFQRRLEDERKKVEEIVDREITKILKSEGFKIDKKTLEFKTFRKRLIELKLIRFRHKKEYVSNKNRDLSRFVEECDFQFNLGILDKDIAQQIEKHTDEKSVVQVKDEQVEEENTFMISQLMNEYVETIKRQKDLREKTLQTYQSSLDLFLEVIGDLPINILSQKHGRKFSRTLEQLPPRRRWDRRYNKKSINQIMKMDVKPTMDSRSVNQYIQRCSSWLNWVIKQGYYDEVNVFHGKSISIGRTKKSNNRQLFNEDQLKLIFKKDHYFKKTLNSPSPCRFAFYWIPIFGLFHGMRLQEISQLHLEDIYPKNKVWVIDMNDKTHDKRLKTSNSKRIIPLHPKLIDLGLLDYVRLVEGKGKNRLFHELSLQRDGYTKNPSRFFNQYLKDLKIKNDVQKFDFHSFRHTCNNVLIQNDVNVEYRNDYLGWSQEGMSKKVYGKPFEPEILSKHCSMNISFNHIKWNDLKVDWKLVNP